MSGVWRWDNVEASVAKGVTFSTATVRERPGPLADARGTALIGGADGRAGFTLIEVLVATGILVMLGTLLVGILSSGLRLWGSGEARRDVYERAQLVMDMLGRDLANVIGGEGAGDAPPAPAAGILPATEYVSERVDSAFAFRAGSEAGGRAWIAFVTLRGGVPGGIFYLCEVSRGEPTLKRGTFTLPGRGADAVASPAALERDLRDPKWVSAHADVVADGVLYAGFQMQDPGGAGNASPDGTGPGWSGVWPPKGNRQGKSRVPAMVRVEITVESDRQREMATALTAGIDGVGRKILLDSTEFIPDPPNWILVDGEWMRYVERGTGSVRADLRGARGAVNVAHPAGARVRSGETFVMLISIPAAASAR